LEKNREWFYQQTKPADEQTLSEARIDEEIEKLAHAHNHGGWPCVLDPVGQSGSSCNTNYGCFNN